MIQVFDTTTLLRLQGGVVQSLENDPITFLRDRFFGPTEEFETESVHFDLLDKKRRIAPFVHPLVEGEVVEQRGFETRFFRPAYVKPKTPINPTDTLKRLPGEPLLGELSLQDRRDAHVVRALMDHAEMLDMREEVMASEILRTGSLTIEGRGFGLVSLDFGRHPDLTIQLTGNDQWGESDADPMGDLREWAGLVRTHSNAVIRDWILEPTAFEALLGSIGDEDKKMLFDSLRGSQSRVEIGPRLQEKLRFEGTIGEFNFWTYNDTYTGLDGTDEDLLPAGSVVGASSALEGLRAYGAILDVRALRATRLWPKMWEEHDPSREWVMSQSAPIVVPLRPNASVGARVFEP